MPAQTEHTVILHFPFLEFIFYIIHYKQVMKHNLKDVLIK